MFVGLTVLLLLYCYPLSIMSIYFGPWKLNKHEIFFVSKLSYGIVNLKPIVPGHVLVIPKRVISRFKDLTDEETSDLWISAKSIAKVIEQEFKGTSTTLTIQDGPQAGQTVDHVHIHIIPRRKGDWADNDEIYKDLDQNGKEFKERLKIRNDQIKGPDNEVRVARTVDEMAEEANHLKSFFIPFEDVWNN